MTTRNVDLLTELGNMLEGGHGDVLREMLSTMLHAVMASEAEAASHRTGRRSRGAVRSFLMDGV